MAISKYDTLTDFAEYKKAIKKDLDKLPANKRVDMHVVFAFPFSDGKKRPAVILGKVSKDVQKNLKDKKIIPKKGKATLLESNGERTLKVQGGVPKGKMDEFMRNVPTGLDKVVESDEPVDLNAVEAMDGDEPDDVVPPKKSAHPEDKPEIYTPDDAQKGVETLKNEVGKDVDITGSTPTTLKPNLIRDKAYKEKDFGDKPEPKEMVEEGQGVYATKGMSDINVAKQQVDEMQLVINQQITRYQDGLKKANEQIAQFTEQENELKGIRTKLNAVKKGESNFDAAQKGVAMVGEELMKISKAKLALKDFYVAKIEKLLDQVKSTDKPKERYELLQPGRNEDAQKVYDQSEKAYAATNRRLMVLGRLDDTTAWANSAGPTDKDRVLQAENWSVGVNDAFMKGGLDQKAEFAMITKLQTEVKVYVKQLLKDPKGKTPDELITELREFVKKKQDPALWTGKMQYNEGFAVSMREVEQLIRDGYTFQEFDPTGNEFAGEGAGTQQMMIPRGAGAKIGEELKGVVDAKAEAHPDDRKFQQLDLRWKRIEPNFTKAQKVARTKLLGAKYKYDTALKNKEFLPAEAAVKEIENLVATHLIEPRRVLQEKFKAQLKSDGFKAHAKDGNVLTLVQKIREAEEALDFVGEGKLIDALEKAVSV